MSYEEFVELVGRLREMQREYFKTRSTMVLFACKELEKQVDGIVATFAAASAGREVEK